MPLLIAMIAYEAVLLQRVLWSWPALDRRFSYPTQSLKRRSIVFHRDSQGRCMLTIPERQDVVRTFHMCGRPYCRRPSQVIILVAVAVRVLDETALDDENSFLCVGIITVRTS